MTGLRALWVTQAYPWDGDPVHGNFHRTQAEALIRAGASVEVVAPSPWVPPFFDRISRKWLCYKLAPQVHQVGGVTVHRPRFLALPRGHQWWCPHVEISAGASRLNISAPDVIHAHFAYPSGLVALELGKRWAVPVVLTLHGSDVNVYPTVNQLSRRRFCRAVNGATAVTAVSEALVRRTLELTGRSPLLMPVGIDMNAYRMLPAKEIARAHLGLPSDRFIVLFVGAISEAKGISELMEAASHLDPRKVAVVLVGSGPLLNKASQLPGVHVCGIQPNSVIPHYMAASDVVVLPSYREGLPTVLVEAGAAGVPVVASTVGGIPELLGDDRGYLIQPGDAAELLSGIRHVMSHYEEAYGRGDRLRRYVGSNYDVGINAGHLMTLYSDTIKASAG